MNFDAYFICATPRTGSTLLCGLLRSSGIAGQPESYFRRGDEARWAQEWDVISAPDAPFTFDSYLNACIRAGKTANGLYACRLMWESMGDLVTALSGRFPSVCGKDDRAVLGHAFGRTGFVYLKRNDIVAQAVSRLRAEQTDVWHVTEEDVSSTPGMAAARYDLERLKGFVREAQEHNAAWEGWFARNGVTPCVVCYEDLSDDPVAETTGVLDFLGLSLPPGKALFAQNKRMADALSQSWVKRFHDEAGF